MNGIYAYIHCKPDGIPFYVGKGKYRRATYLGERNQHHKNIVNKYGAANILKGKLECSSDAIAYELEQGLIKTLRNMGVQLCNLTAGGDGGRSPTDETRQRLSIAAKKRGVSAACQKAKVKALKGKKLSEEHKAKVAAGHLGKVFTLEHRQNISISAKKRGVNRTTLEAAWKASRGRVQPEEERIRRGKAISAALSAKKANK